MSERQPEYSENKALRSDDEPDVEGHVLPEAEKTRQYEDVEKAKAYSEGDEPYEGGEEGKV